MRGRIALDVTPFNVGRLLAVATERDYWCRETEKLLRTMYLGDPIALADVRRGMIYEMADRGLD